MRNKVVFFSVFYPNKVEYHLDFLDSLNNQTYKNFDLLIINDGVVDLERLLRDNYEGNYYILDVEGSMLSVREQGLLKVIELGYEDIIFGDSDDYFTLNRIEYLRFLLEDWKVIVNDFHLVGEDQSIIQKNYLSKRLSELEVINYDFIRNKNILGFTNTALKVELLKGLSYDTCSPAIDWYLFSQVLWKLRDESCFTAQCATFYRQYQSNIASLKEENTPKEAKRRLEVKLEHYKSLMKLDNSMEVYYNNAKSQLDSDNIVVNKTKGSLWWE